MKKWKILKPCFFFFLYHLFISSSLNFSRISIHCFSKFFVLVIASSLPSLPLVFLFSYLYSSFCFHSLFLMYISLLLLHNFYLYSIELLLQIRYMSSSRTSKVRPKSLTSGLKSLSESFAKQLPLVNADTLLYVFPTAGL